MTHAARCTATRSNGQPCRAYALTGSPWCPSHQPEHICTRPGCRYSRVGRSVWCKHCCRHPAVAKPGGERSEWLVSPGSPATSQAVTYWRCQVCGQEAVLFIDPAVVAKWEASQ